jgi:hypothetical protein
MTASALPLLVVIASIVALGATGNLFSARSTKALVPYVF